MLTDGMVAAGFQLSACLVTHTDPIERSYFLSAAPKEGVAAERNEVFDRIHRES
jgi:hypothetical protein